MKKLQESNVLFDLRSVKISFVFISLISILCFIPQHLSAKNDFDHFRLYPYSNSTKHDKAFALNTWEYANSNGQPDSRHECAYVELGGKFYLIGGRGNPALNIYNPQTNTWTSGTNIPNGKELHHFQAVAYNNKIYIIGAFTGGFPTEKPVADIYIYDPAANSWTILANQIPSNRRRGAAGAVVYNNKIYIVGGITNGHTDGWVNWMDEFDPANLTWKVLPDAPHQRDHLQAGVINDKIYIAGGRRSAYPNTINLTEASVDVFSFSNQQWSTLPAAANIPTPRAGTATLVLNNELIVIAGESGNNGYHRQVEAFNPQTNTWRSLAQTNEGRNGPGGIAYNGKLYIVAGTVNGTEVSSQEIYSTGATNTSPVITANIPDINTTVNASPVNINLTNYFNDDGGSSNLLYTIASNSNTGLVQASISNKTTLQISFASSTSGTGNIRIKATDQQGNSVEDVFSIIVSGNSTPAPANSLFINSGGAAHQYGSQQWTADKHFSGGSTFSGSTEIAGTENDNIYLTERYGNNFSYSIPLASGTYTVNLHFAEIFWSAAGKRVFNVNIENGKYVSNSLDIFALAGKNKAYIKSYSVQVSDGALDINFSTVTDNAKISAIEIIPGNTCAMVSGLSSSQVTTTGAVINWATSSGASKYQAEYRKQGSEAWTVISSGLTTNSYSLTGLTAGTNYEWRVKGYCSSGYGAYSEGSFTTIIPVANAGSDQSITLPANSANLSGKGSVTGGTITSFTWTQVNGPSTAAFTNKTTANTSVSNLIAGTYTFSLIVKDGAGNASKPDQVLVVVSSSSAATQPAITNFTLVDATTNRDILILNDGAVINGSTIPAGGVNIRANVNQVATSKVVITLSGAQNVSRTESVAPYALFGDSNGDYDNWQFANGSYTLTATPYSSNGTAVTGRTIKFSINNSARSISNVNTTTNWGNAFDINAASRTGELLQLKTFVYPNPSQNSFTLRIYGDINQPVRYSVTDIKGSVIQSGTLRVGNVSIGGEYRRGIYFLRLVQGSQSVSTKIIKE
jgi:predicted heme/steroid binding protein